MNIRHKCLFKLFTYGKNKDRHQIRLRVTYNCQRIDLSTGCQILDLDYWDKKYQSVKEGYLGPKGETAISINTELRNVKDQIETAFKFFEANDIIPTPSQLVEKYEERLHGTVPKKPEPEKKKKEEKPIGERADYDTEDLVGIKNSTIDKKLGYLKWFLKWATDKGYNTNLAYRTFKPTLKTTQKKVIYLSKDELKSIMAIKLEGDTIYLEPIRDIFMFCCFSSLRYSDASSLKWNDVKDNHIEVTTVKTADSISIEINDMVRTIIEKYRSFPDKRSNLVFPYYTNQAMNRDLKKLCKLSGINEEIRITSYKGNERIDKIKEKWELVGTHTGRRTFIVNALSRGIAPNVVMKWTGIAIIRQ